MSAEAFMDTNLFIYQLESLDETKAAIADGIITRAIEEGNACISFQVVRECLNTTLRKAEIPLSVEQTGVYMRDVLEPLWKVYPNADLYQRAIDIQGRYGFSFYDSLIVASALNAGCRYLYTEELQHGRRIEDLTVTDPFRGA